MGRRLLAAGAIVLAACASQPEPRVGSAEVYERIDSLTERSTIPSLLRRAATWRDHSAGGTMQEDEPDDSAEREVARWLRLADGLVRGEEVSDPGDPGALSPEKIGRAHV